MIIGRVMKGEGVAGKLYGVPTANLDAMVMKEHGVYAARVRFDAQQFDGVVCIQPGKTEVHLLDYKGNLYGRELRVELLEKVSDFTAFRDEASMRDKIQSDVDLVRTFLYGTFGADFA
ncbi:MAG: riboflavin kinase [Candidatus Uhrbacteria bacterium]|nr:riboflavin kinase [Candidatus Uhrbacteria bacterium]